MIVVGILRAILKMIMTCRKTRRISRMEIVRRMYEYSIKVQLTSTLPLLFGLVIALKPNVFPKRLRILGLQVVCK